MKWSAFSVVETYSTEWVIMCIYIVILAHLVLLCFKELLDTIMNTLATCYLYHYFVYRDRYLFYYELHIYVLGTCNVFTFMF